MSAHARKWSDDSGQFSIEADFVAFSGDNVQLKKSDGVLIQVPLSRLSQGDKTFLEAQRATTVTDPFSARTTQTGPTQKLSNDQLKEIVATGFGLTPEDAFKSALSTAIEQTVGLFVDAQTVVQNDEIIKSRILTASPAYIDHYDVIKRSQDGGLHQCRILARVNLRQLQQAISDNNVAVNSLAGKDLAIALSTMEKSDADTAAVIVDLIRSLPNKVLVANVNGSTKALPGEDSTTARLRIPLSLAIDQTSYASHVREIIYRADKLALGKYSTRCKLGLQKPISSANPIEESNWNAMVLSVPAQKDLESVIFPPSDALVPDRWFAVYDPVFPYSRRVRDDNNGVRERAFAMMKEANQAFDGGIAQVMALQEKRQEPLSTLVVAHEIGAAGNVNLMTYAFPHNVLSEFKEHVSAKISIDVELMDEFGKTVEAASSVAMTTQDDRYIYGFVNSTYRFMWGEDKRVPKAVAIVPGLRFADMYRADLERGVVDETDKLAIITQFGGHLYIDLPRESLERVRSIKLKANWAPDRHWNR